MLRRRHRDFRQCKRYAEFRSTKQKPQHGHTSSRETEVGHVSSRSSHRETEAELDRESVATTLFSSESRGKRDRELNCAHALRDRDNIKKILGRKVDPAMQGEKEAQQIMYQAEAEIEARNCEKRNRDHSFQEINQEFESQRLRLNQASRCAEETQRDQISLYREFGIEKWKLPRESCNTLPRN